MNTNYLNTLPEIANKFNIDLQEGEKVIFTAKPSCFGTETGRVLGDYESEITLTNKRLIAQNGVGIWTIDLDEIVSWKKIESGKFIMKSVYIAVHLNEEIVFNDGQEKMNGFRFYFNKKDMASFESIMGIEELINI